jgi:hypothetical protein
MTLNKCQWGGEGDELKTGGGGRKTKSKRRKSYKKKRKSYKKKRTRRKYSRKKTNRRKNLKGAGSDEEGESEIAKARRLIREINYLVAGQYNPLADIIDIDEARTLLVRSNWDVDETLSKFIISRVEPEPEPQEEGEQEEDDEEGVAPSPNISEAIPPSAND